MIIVPDIISSLEQDENAIIEIARKLAKIPDCEIDGSFIVKSSIDARHGKKPQIVSSVGFYLKKDEEKYVKDKIVSKNILDKLPPFEFGENKLENTPVIIGFGPAGMFLALVLAQNGYNPIVFERGYDVDMRVEAVKKFWESGILNTQSNVQFGEGGAGTFSDGKLTTRVNDPLCNFILKELVRLGAPEEILYKAKPHIGTDKLRDCVKNIKSEIISLGGKVLTSSQLTDISIKNGAVNKIFINGNPLPCSNLFLAIGHSARDTFEMLMAKDILMETKPFSIGVRIEHLQETINNGLYGRYSGHPMLPQGEYQLSLRKNDRAVYTFCMCPGGLVVPSSSEINTVVTNGMSEFARNEKNANSALVVSVSEKDFGNNPMKAIEFQRKYEQIAFKEGGSNYSAPAQSVDLFLKNRKGLNISDVTPSYSLGVKPCDFNAIFPDEISGMMRDGLVSFGRKIKGFDSNNAILTGIETRTSSPVRILRGENRQSVSVKGLYPCGEGAGYAGGIMSAALDGIKSAIEFMKNYKPN